MSNNSNSPALLIMSQSSTRRGSISLNNGELIDLGLPNSETNDTKDVYIMAVEDADASSPSSQRHLHRHHQHLSSDSGSPSPCHTMHNVPHLHMNTNSGSIDSADSHRRHNTLAVPKWTVDDAESADDEYDYDSEAHQQTDEDIIIKRVLAKCT